MVRARGQWARTMIAMGATIYVASQERIPGNPDVQEV